MSQRAVLLMLGVLLAVPPASGQGVSFTGRLIRGNGQPVASTTVRVVNVGTSVTDGGGLFEVSVPAEMSVVTVEVEDSLLAVQYPIGGRAAVPREASGEPVNFVLGEAVSTVVARALARQQRDLRIHLEEIRVADGEIDQALRALREEMQKLIDLNEVDLQRALALEERKAEYYPVISSAIRTYVTKAKDLKDAYKYVAERAFTDDLALAELRRVILEYNPAFEKLDSERLTYEKAVADYWQDDQLSTELRSLLDYALGEVHRLNIHRLNESGKLINDVNRGHLTGSEARQAMQRINAQVDLIVGELDVRLAELDQRANRLLIELAEG